MAVQVATIVSNISEAAATQQNNQGKSIWISKF
jgi:hypothetical protein